MNIIEKAIAKRAHLDMVIPGDQVTLEPSVVYISENRALAVISAFYELGFESVCLPFKAFVQLNPIVSNEREKIKNFCDINGLHLMSSDEDVLKEFLTEEELVIAGVDDSINLLGANGSIPLLISPTKMAHCLGTGKVKMIIPETLYIEISGRLPTGTRANEFCDSLLKYFNDSLIGVAIVIGGNVVGSIGAEAKQIMTRFISESGATLGTISPLGPLGQVESVVKIRTQDISRPFN